MFKRYKLKNFDFLLVLMVISVTIIGILAIGSAEASVQPKQIQGMIMGIILMLVLAFIDYSFILRFSWILYIITNILLILVKVLGDETNGSTRWLDLGFIRLQPSELAKLLLILFFAQYIMKYREKLNTPKVLLGAIALAAPPLYLIYSQPDLSTTIMTAILLCVMFFVGGISYKIIGGILAVIVPIGMIFMSIVIQPDQTLLEDYQRDRIMAWLDMEAYAATEGYQQTNSQIAIGSGQLWGKGLDNNVIASVKNGNFISEAQTDFIFAVIGEELGFVGAVAVITLLLGIAIKCVMTARTAKDTAGMIIASGVGALVGFQSCINISVATALIPNTGIPLPFVSYGLSSLLTLYMGMGIVLNIRLQRKKLY